MTVHLTRSGHGSHRGAGAVRGVPAAGGDGAHPPTACSLGPAAAPVHVPPKEARYRHSRGAPSFQPYISSSTNCRKPSGFISKFKVVWLALHCTALDLSLTDLLIVLIRIPKVEPFATCSAHDMLSHTAQWLKIRFPSEARWCRPLTGCTGGGRCSSAPPPWRKLRRSQGS